MSEPTGAWQPSARERERQDVRRRLRRRALLVSGGPRGFHPPDEETRLASFADLTRREIPDAGHLTAIEQPSAVNDVLLEVLSDWR